jgi:hypothetical protein
MYVQIPAGISIPACGYYLIQLVAGTSGGVALPVTADATGTIAVSATAGKFGLVTSGTSGTCSTTWVDLVSFGGATLCWEGTAPTPAPSNTKAVVRGGAGMTDTDQNSTDFASVTCDASLPIHSSSSAVNPLCAPLIPGACCLRAAPGACVVVTPAECELQNGIFLGPGTICDFGICLEVPANKTSWGQIKTIYR